MTALMELLPDVHIDAPDVSGPFAVFPLVAAEAPLEYVSFAEAATRGVKITELPGRASVNDLLVVNPLDVAVLLYEGEELLGAQQNRTVDAAVLVPAGATMEVPVSCVERNRWDGSRHREPLAPSPQTAFPALRAQKSTRMRAAMAAGAIARADQGEVWDAVGPEAMEKEFRDRGPGLDELAAAVRRRPGQTGALVAVNGRFTVADHVSRADVWAALCGPLVRGYALEALRAGDAGARAPSAQDARAWLRDALGTAVRRAPAVGLGERVHFDGAHAGGTGLAVGDHLVQVGVYAS
jgi:ARG/rhodanese/phosphatase superfamily protein